MALVAFTTQSRIGILPAVTLLTNGEADDIIISSTALLIHTLQYTKTHTGVTNPRSKFSRVVFPTPLGPTIATAMAYIN